MSYYHNDASGNGNRTGSSRTEQRRVVYRTGYVETSPSPAPQVHRTGYARTVPSSQPRQVHHTGYAVASPSYRPQQVYHTGYAQAIPPLDPPEPTIISGWEHSTYAHRSDRYQYLGKNEDGEPEWLDFGPKGGRR